MNNNLKQTNSHLRLLVAALFAAGPLAIAAGCDDAESTTPADAADHADHEGHDEDEAGHGDHDDHNHEEHGDAGLLGAAHLALAAVGGH
ncbi:MAG: hypothetical protein AAF656_00015 [Planctomycetota bacterium]